MGANAINPAINAGKIGADWASVYGEQQSSVGKTTTPPTNFLNTQKTNFQDSMLYRLNNLD